MDRTNTLKVLGRLRREKMQNILRPEHHDHFNMGDWAYLVNEFGQHIDEIFGAEPPTICNTAACIAGTAVLTLDPEGVFVPVQMTSTGTYWQIAGSYDWSEKGAELLGLSDYEADALFVTGKWPYAATKIDELDGAIWLLSEMLAGRLTLEKIEEDLLLNTDYGLSLDVTIDKFAWRHNGTWLPNDGWDTDTLQKFYDGSLGVDDQDEFDDF